MSERRLSVPGPPSGTVNSQQRGWCGKGTVMRRDVQPKFLGLEDRVLVQEEIRKKKVVGNLWSSSTDLVTCVTKEYDIMFRDLGNINK